VLIGAADLPAQDEVWAEVDLAVEIFIRAYAP
jgi:hypothetical protein